MNRIIKKYLCADRQVNKLSKTNINICRIKIIYRELCNKKIKSFYLKEVRMLSMWTGRGASRHGRFKNSKQLVNPTDNCENAINYPVQIVIVNNK